MCQVNAWEQAMGLAVGLPPALPQLPPPGALHASARLSAGSPQSPRSYCS